MNIETLGEIMIVGGPIIALISIVVAVLAYRRGYRRAYKEGYDKGYNGEEDQF